MILKPDYKWNFRSRGGRLAIITTNLKLDITG